jgi:hypothetical protein
VAFAVAVGLGLCAAHYYEVPQLSGAPSHNGWFERDALFSMASSAVALAVGLLMQRSATGPGAVARASAVLRALIWAGFSLLFLALWGEYLFLFTLLVAPTHGLAALRLLGLWTRWRSELKFNRPG